MTRVSKNRKSSSWGGERCYNSTHPFSLFFERHSHLLAAKGPEGWGSGEQDGGRKRGSCPLQWLLQTAPGCIVSSCGSSGGRKNEGSWFPTGLGNSQVEGQGRKGVQVLGRIPLMPPPSSQQDQMQGQSHPLSESSQGMPNNPAAGPLPVYVDLLRGRGPPHRGPQQLLLLLHQPRWLLRLWTTSLTCSCLVL